MYIRAQHFLTYRSHKHYLTKINNQCFISILLPFEEARSYLLGHKTAIVMQQRHVGSLTKADKQYQLGGHLSCSQKIILLAITAT